LKYRNRVKPTIFIEIQNFNTHFDLNISVFKNNYMRSISHVTSTPLLWKQPSLRTLAFELKYSEEVMATLTFRSVLGTLATGTAAEGEWSFKRQGFLKTFVTVRTAGSEENLAIFHNNTWNDGGTLELQDGHTFKANSNFWSTKFEFIDAREEPLIRFSNIGGFKLHSELEILPPGRLLSELPMMVLLGWYLTVMHSRDGAVVAAVF
jgi:hypothetical protein